MQKDIFKAIADPTRREIINLIAHQSMNLNAVAENFDMSRPAVSKHIKILTQCGLLVIKQQGRERFCKADLKQLKQVTDWAEQYRRFWTQKLDDLDTFLTEEQKTTDINHKNKKL
jgi:DNA-binding transcriptional ArsR family regulator